MICDTSRPRGGIFLGLLLGLALSPLAPAQEKPASTAKPKPNPPAAAAPADDEAAEEETTTPVETDPLVLTILATRPTTPEARLQDIRALLQLDRPALAKAYLAELAAALPGEDELVRLQRQFGSAFFLRLATEEALQPEGGTVADAFMQAVGDRLRNAERLSGLVARMCQPDAPDAARRLAAAELVQSGPYAVPPLLAALADPSVRAAHARLRLVLVSLGEAAVEPLAAALAAPRAAVQTAAADALSGIRSGTAVPYLLPPALGAGVDAAVQEAARSALQHTLGGVPAVEDAVALLARRRDAYLDGMAAGPTDEHHQVLLWTWDAQQQALAERAWAPDDAALSMGAQFAQWVCALAPGEEMDRQLYLAAALEVARRESGYDRPLPAEAEQLAAQLVAAGPQTTEGVLALALDRGWCGAALSAVDALAADGRTDLLQSLNGQPRVLVRALVSPHRRVQVAAARAILQRDPHRAYVGSSFLPDLLGYLAVSAGRPRILIGEPRAEVARRLVSQSIALGFDAEAAGSGRDLIQQAGASPDVVLILISTALDRPGYRELVQLLRHDPHAADLPIGILAHETQQRQAEQLAADDALTAAFPPPQSQEDLAADIARMLERAGRRVLSTDERAQHASFALDALAHLAGDMQTYGFYDLLHLEPRLRQAQAVDASAIQASRVLGLLGTPSAQQALVELASAREQPLATRQAAAEALRVAVSRRGLLLTSSRLQQQYDLYNASEQLDRETQAVLGSILDTLEGAVRSGAAPAPHDD